MPQNYTAVTIIDDDYANLKIPNAFTPNGDGINDTWNIPNLAYDTQCKVKIYDRYGTLVYTSTGYGISWDGRNNGQNVPAGTYYYAINSHGRTFSGTVSVIR